MTARCTNVENKMLTFVAVSKTEMPEPTSILDLELRIRYEKEDLRPSKTFCANHLIQTILLNQ